MSGIDKRSTGLLLIAIVALATVSGYGMYLVSSFRSFTSPPESKTISVSGNAAIKSMPDTAIVRVGVQTQAKTAKEAVDSNAELMSKVIAAMKEGGIAEADMETTGFSLTPITSPDKQPVEILGYVCFNTLQIKVRQIDSVGNFLDTAVESGANIIQGVEFTLSDPRSQQLQGQALKLAVENARSQADAVAEAAGVRILGISSISVGYSYIPYEYANVAPRAETPIVPGQVQVSASVQMSYIVG